MRTLPEQVPVPLRILLLLASHCLQCLDSQQMDLLVVLQSLHAHAIVSEVLEL